MGASKLQEVSGSITATATFGNKSPNWRIYHFINLKFTRKKLHFLYFNKLKIIYFFTNLIKAFEMYRKS